MQDVFQKSAATPSEAEQVLRDWGIEYEKRPGGTLFVAGNVNIASSGRTRLPDLTSVAVGGSFYCQGNEIDSLKGAPPSVGGDFICSNNPLISLEHAPQSVGGGFYCNDNQLTSLEGAPTTFKELRSDFGEFNSWDELPEELRVSPGTRARLEEEREAARDKAIHAVTVLQSSLRLGGPLKLRSKAPA